MTMQKGLPPEGWNEKVLALGGNFLQSRDWAAFNQAMGREPIYDEGESWCWSGAVRHGRGGINYLFVPYGPSSKNEAAFAAALDSLADAGRDLGVMFVRFEPVGGFSNTELKRIGAVEFAEVDPIHTNVLDLTKTEAELRSGLASGHRYGINAAPRRGVSVRAGSANEVTDFLKMMADTAKYNKIKAFDSNYYQKLMDTLAPLNSARLYFAEHESEKVASSIVVDFGDTRSYLFAAADQAKNRKLGAAVALVWQMILDAKAAGKTRFDFWGVAPAGVQNHKWAGLSTFKRSFGGVDKDYHGTWDIPIKSAKYKIYRSIKKFT